MEQPFSKYQSIKSVLLKADSEMRPSIYTLKIMSLFCVFFFRERWGQVLMFIITNCLFIHSNILYSFLSLSFCIEQSIHELWLKSIGRHPLIWAPFKFQIKDSLLELSFGKQGLLLEKWHLSKRNNLLFSYSFHLKTWSQIALKQNNFHIPKALLCYPLQG